MLVADAVGTAVGRLGAEAAFGVAGSGNLLLINAMRDAGVEYYATCHEAGAVAAADGYSRVSGEVGVATVHQGPGFTNAVTPLTEATKSASPLVVLAPETPAEATRLNQALDQGALARCIGAEVVRLRDPDAAVETVSSAFDRARERRRPVVLTMPTDLLVSAHSSDEVAPPPPSEPTPVIPSSAAVDAIVAALDPARRPLIVAGRGAVVAGAAPLLRRLAERCGGLLATSVVARGLFAGDPFSLDFVGGLASPLTTELAMSADLVLGFGTSFDPWTTCGGRVPGPESEIVLVDDDAEVLGRRRDAAVTVLGDAALTAAAVLRRVGARGADATWRTPDLAERLAAARPAPDRRSEKASALLDPHSLTLALEKILPGDRIVGLDSGHFIAFPSMYLSSPDGRSFLFAQGFQSVGLGLGISIGAAVASPRRVVAALIGDGGARMSLLELETAVRYSLRLAVVVFDDGGYGAEIHDFAPLGIAVDAARFPTRDYAAIARALGAGGVTVTALDHLDALSAWLEAPDRPLLLDCKVDPGVSAAPSLTEEGAAEWSVSIPALSS